jgi:SAM-dependent methyltransferase
VGTGRFAAELGITLGVEPAEAMAAMARNRGIKVVRGSAEALPLESESADAVFFVTVLCFVHDLRLALSEAHRVLRPSGQCIIGFLPRDSELGQLTVAHHGEDAFMKHATLRTRAELLQALASTKFALDQSVQTLFGLPQNFESAVQPAERGHDRGSFVVLRALKADFAVRSSTPPS